MGYDMKKNIFIIGARGYHYNYGGWETFVDNLVDNYNDSNTNIYVSELASDKNSDKKLIKKRKNLYIYSFYVNTKGSAMMFFYTIKAYFNALEYIKKNKIHDAYIYILGLKLGPLLAFKKNLRKKYNMRVYLNPDGLEHLRDKWNKFVKCCFLMSEWSMVRHADLVVCDGLGIERYMNKKYPKVRTTYIAYGANKIKLDNVDEKRILDEYNILSNNYCLMVGRCVPENNYELVIKEFMKSKIDKKLVIISNLSGSDYYKELVRITGCDSDERIIFIDGVYDKVKLTCIRKNAYLYIHGHSVGGTNPSLLESLSITDINVLYDVCFNRDIACDSALYFKESGSLTKILNNTKKLDREKEKLGKKAHDIIENNFTWDIIVNKYKEIFK